MKTFKGLVTALCLLAGATAANALVFNYNTVISGDQPQAPPPWLKAEFSGYRMDVNGSTTDGVLLTLSATGLTFDNEFVSKWAFNTTLSDLSNLSYKIESLYGTALKQNEPVQFDLDDVSSGATGHHARYDVGFTFITSNGRRFQTFDFAKIFLYGPAELTPEMFNTTNADGYYAEAHIQGIDGSGGGSSWVVPVTPVPEPGTMVLLGAGFLGLAIYGKRRKNG